jgi:hypothetical protein
MLLIYQVIYHEDMDLLSSTTKDKNSIGIYL